MTDQIDGQAPADETPAVADAVVDDAAQAAPEAQDEAPADEAEAPAPKKTAQDRINELTRKQREAERDAEYWREQALKGQQPAAQPAPATSEAPDPQGYDYGETDARYISDLARYEARQAAREEYGQHAAQESLRHQVSAFEARLAQAFPDGEPEGVTALRRAPSLPVAVQEIILASENGPKLADHLGSRPAELHRLSTLSPALQAYELAKLETALTVAKPKTATTAPDPTPQVRGTGGQFKVSADTSDFLAFEKAYP